MYGSNAHRLHGRFQTARLPFIYKQAIQGLDPVWTQPSVEAKHRRTVWTNYCVAAPHIEVDVRMIVWWRNTNAIELLRPSANFREGAIILEFGIVAPDHVEVGLAVANATRRRIVGRPG